MSIQKDLGQTPAIPVEPTIKLDDDDESKPMASGTINRTPLVAASQEVAIKSEPGVGTLEEAADVLSAMAGIQTHESQKSDTERKATPQFDTPSPPDSSNPSEPLEAGSLHLMPMTSSAMARYGVCRLRSANPASGMIRLEWLQDLIWKRGEKSTGRRVAWDPEFTVTESDFRARRLEKRRVSADLVSFD